MAMTQKRAERLTGYEVRPLSGHGDRIRFGAFEGKELIAEAAGVVDWLALESLVEQGLPHPFAARPGGELVAVRPMPTSTPLAYSSPAVPLPWRHTSSGEPGAGLLGLSSGDSPNRALAVR
jgi:hypothetical protein